MNLLATSLPEAQWFRRSTGIKKVMGSIPVVDSQFFFVTRSRQLFHLSYKILDIALINQVKMLQISILREITYLKNS